MRDWVYTLSWIWVALAMGLVGCSTTEVNQPTAVLSNVEPTATVDHTPTPQTSPTSLPTATATTEPTATMPPTATAVPPTPTPAMQIYSIQDGDTLYGLAETYGITVDDIVQANDMANPDVLNVGDNLNIPLPTPTAGPTSTTDPNAQPTNTPTPTPTPSGPPTSLNGLAYSDFVIMPPEVIANIREIYANGEALGRNPNHFSKLGDSTSLNPHFLARFDEAPYNLGDYAYLQATIDHYQGAYGNYGAALRIGLHSWNVFDPFWASKNWCQPNEHVLSCELRLNNPSVLFIRLGSNDAGAPSLFDQNMREVVQFAIDNGIVPIIATKADRFEGSNANNEMLRQIAADYQIPIWDFDIVADTLPGRGLGDDNVHVAITSHPHDFTDPVTFQTGHPVQDLSALIVLDELRQVLDN